MFPKEHTTNLGIHDHGNHLFTPAHKISRILVLPGQNSTRITALIWSILNARQHGKLKLVELKTLPTTGLLDGTSANAATPNATDANLEQTNTRIQSEVSKEYATPVFKHGVEITIEGRYLDLLAYVSELEKMPWHILWSKAGLNTEQPTPNQWPINRLKLTVYTLSLDQAWLSI